MALVRRARKINRLLADLYPDAHCELDFADPLELTVAVILSAQCTDVRVNQVTPALFARYKTAEDYASAERIELEELIRPTGFYRNKAASILGLGRELCDRFGGEVPGRLEDLVTLPGVGRKTGNVVRSVWFGEPGLPVDTHVTRLTGRLKLTNETDPVKIEHDIGGLVPPDEWGLLSLRLIEHGRQICDARRPRCDACVLADICPSAGKVGNAPKR